MTQTRFARAAIVAALVGGAIVAGCGESERLTGLHPNQDQMYWSLTLNHKGITLSADTSQPEYYTLQLVATPRTIHGEPIEGLGKPTFTSSDTNAVVVDSNGMIRAKAVKAAPVLIVARLSSEQDNITNYDTAFVVVTATANPPATFSMAPDRTTFGMGFDTVIKARMTDSAGDPITGIKVFYWSSNRSIAPIDSGGLISPKQKGTVQIAASVMSYGVTYTDTVDITIGDPEVFQVEMTKGPNATDPVFFFPQEITIKAGQGIAWNSAIPPGAFGNVTFADPTNVGPSPATGATGNIPPFIATKHIRMFPVPGTYEYTNTLNGATGKVIVTP